METENKNRFFRTITDGAFGHTCGRTPPAKNRKSDDRENP